MKSTRLNPTLWARRLLVVQAVGFVLLVAAADLGWARSALGFVHVIPGGDKLAHFLIVGSLAFSAHLALAGATLSLAGLRLHWADVLVAVPVALEEASQFLLASRDCDPLDLASDFAGILVFGLAARALLRD